MGLLLFWYCGSSTESYWFHLKKLKHQDNIDELILKETSRSRCVRFVTASAATYKLPMALSSSADGVQNLTTVIEDFAIQ
jgi:hypothetical protein